MYLSRWLTSHSILCNAVISILNKWYAHFLKCVCGNVNPLRGCGLLITLAAGSTIILPAGILIRLTYVMTGWRRSWLPTTWLTGITGALTQWYLQSLYWLWLAGLHILRLALVGYCSVATGYLCVMSMKANLINTMADMALLFADREVIFCRMTKLFKWKYVWPVTYRESWYYSFVLYQKYCVMTDYWEAIGKYHCIVCLISDYSVIFVIYSLSVFCGIPKLKWPIFNDDWYFCDASQ